MCEKEETYIEVDISTAKFPQETMLLDREDLVMFSGLPRVYCVETKGKRSRTKYARSGDTYVHRLLMGSPKGLQVDHINGNGLDNRRANLRVVTNKVNGMNTAKSINNTSGYTGVSFVKRTNKWEANIKVDYKKIHLGHYDTLEEACAARKAAEVKYGFHENHGREQIKII